LAGNDRFFAQLLSFVCVCPAFGCGFGKHEAALALKYPECHFTGLDIYDNAINECKRKFSNIENLKYVKEDIFNIQKTYDFVYTIEVLEHIKEPIPFIKKLTEIGETLMIIVPNFLERYNNPEGRKLMWEINEHYHIGFSKEYLSECLKGFGFQILESNRYDSICYFSFGGCRL
jgi:cyclopropane fatty-acyl-phospholipid synthase-like methyltransferase